MLPSLGRLSAILALVIVPVGLAGTSADASGTARACLNPSFVTSNPDGGKAMGAYYVHNNMWNASGYNVSETLKACSAGNWYVTAKADNRSGDGAVKTYPNAHRDFNREPRLSSFTSITSRFASRSPHVGIYNGAFDIWMNGVACCGSTEVMIWTDNFHQFPSGSLVKRGIVFSNRTWRLYATGDHGYLAFVPNKPLPNGTINLKKRLTSLVTYGYLPKGSTVGQICFGYEIVSTAGAWHRFKIDQFWVHTRKR